LLWQGFSYAGGTTCEYQIKATNRFHVPHVYVASHFIHVILLLLPPLQLLSKTISDARGLQAWLPSRASKESMLDSQRMQSWLLRSL
jgi:hypothetical protein